MSQPKPRYALRNAQGFYYCFTDRAHYCGPQLSRDPRNAKLMTAQGAGSVRRMLADPRYYGQPFERVSESELPPPA